MIIVHVRDTPSHSKEFQNPGDLIIDGLGEREVDHIGIAAINLGMGGADEVSPRVLLPQIMEHRIEKKGIPNSMIVKQEFRMDTLVIFHAVMLER
jgi:hypothetical protein